MSKWHDFLAESIQDPAQIEDLQEFMGMCCAGPGGESYGKALVLEGPGLGKCMVREVLRALVCDEAVFRVAELLGCPLYRYQLQAWRVLILDRMPDRGLFEDLVLRRSVTVARKHGPQTTITPQWGLVFHAPHDRPMNPEREPRLERLLLRVQCVGERMDPSLLGKLLLTIEEIRAWASIGHERLVARGCFRAGQAG